MKVATLGSAGAGVGSGAASVGCGAASVGCGAASVGCGAAAVASGCGVGVGPQAANSIDSTTAKTDRVNNQLFFMIENLLLAFSKWYLAAAHCAPRHDQNAVRITSFYLFPELARCL
jgi:hypothetical protein